MYAVVEIGGQQYRVSPNEEILAPKLAGEVGSSIQLDKVLLVSSEQTVRVGRPVVEGATVKATILAHGQGPKVVVFKKKRRKGYRVKKGHRQEYTALRIEEIALS